MCSPSFTAGGAGKAARSDPYRPVSACSYQLPEIDADGAFAALSTRLQAPELVENRRQVEPWERASLTELRTGDANVAFATYETHQRVYHHDDGDRLRERLVEDWWSARRHDSIMLAGRNADVDDLNQRARRHLAGAGVIGNDQLEVDRRRFAVGDQIHATRNNYRLGVLNGTRATITHIDATTATIYAQTDAHEVVLPREYIDAGHVAHAYTMTFHKAQGMTVHSAFVLVDDTLDRPRAYTGVSRGIHHNTLYITDRPDQHAEERHTPEPANDAVAARW